MDTNGTAHWVDTEAGQQLQARLTSEKTLKALDHLLARIDTLENAVERLTTVMEQGPGLVSMAADTVDETIRDAASKGIDIEQRLGNALHLAEKLTAPEMVQRVDNFIEMTEQLPGLTSMAVDVVDETVRQASQSGVDIEQRLGAALQIAEKLTAPAMVEKLNQVFELTDQLPGLSSMAVDIVDETYRQAAARGINIEDRAKALLHITERLTQPRQMEQLNALLDLSDQLPGLIAMGVDVFDDTYRSAAARGLDLETLSAQGVTVLKQLSTILGSDEFKSLLQSGLLSPSTVGVVAKAGDALVESRNMPTKKMGMFGLLGALNDSDRQRALGFLMNFAKQFGQQLDESKQ
jgi:hypothetical protein